MAKQKIPKRLQAVLWSSDIKDLNLERDKRYIIHQILRYGTLDDINWLFHAYSREKVRDVFLSYPSKNYGKESLNFIKNYILGLKGHQLNQDAYVTSIHGPVRPRAVGSL